MKLFLFGPPRLEIDDQAIKIPRRKAVALLSYLATTRQTHQRDSLATLFWPEAGQSAARASLRRELHALQQSIGDQWLQTSRDSVALRPDAAIWLDVEEFERALSQMASHDHGKEELCPECADHLGAAVELYTDDFLADFKLPDCPDFDSWQLFKTETLHRNIAEALEQLVSYYKADNQYTLAISHARRWLAQEIMNEPVHRELMRLYALAGQQSAALRQYDECVRILDQELGVPPEEETTNLHAEIRTRHFFAPDTGISDANEEVGNNQESAAHLQPTVDKQSPKNNLSVQPTSFVGREEEVEAIQQLLLAEEGCRLLTLIGPGGIGKTRLSLQVAQVLVDAEDSPWDGIYFVSLASITDEADLVRTIANAVGYSFTGGEAPQTQLESFLRAQQLLLVLDNFEHLLGGAQLLSALLTATAELSLMITSREALDLPAEWLYPLGGLAAPSSHETLSEIEANSAIQLFLQRVRRTDSTFAFTAEVAPKLVRICQLVNGMPLGLELAAAWVNTLTLDELADEIASNIDILASEMPNIPERHRSLRAVFEQTWSRLTEEERKTLRQLAVFRGTFTREAAQRVTNATLLAISSLIDRALCRQQEGRYDLHELLRQFAFERMDEEEQHIVQAEHGRYFGELLGAQRQYLMTAAAEEMVQAITDDFDNILAAWRYLIERIQAGSETERSAALIGQYAPVLAAYFDRRALFWEGQRTFQHAISVLDVAVGNQPAQATTGSTTAGKTTVQESYTQLQLEQTGIAMHLGRFPEAKANIQALLPQLQAPSDQRQRAEALTHLGLAYVRMGDFSEAEQYLEEATTLFGRLGSPLKSTAPMICMGIVKSRTLQYAEAVGCFQRAAEIFEDAGYATGVARCLSNIGSTYADRADISGLGHRFVRGAVSGERPVRFEYLLSDALLDSKT